MKKKYLIITIYTLAFLIIPYLCNYCPTQSKYIKDNDKALVYADSLYSLYKGNKISIDLAPNYEKEKDKIKLLLVFDRNSNIGTFKEESYTINIPNCTIDNIIAPNSKSISGNKITYDNNKNSQISVTATCMLPTDSSLINDLDVIIKATVKEKIKGDISDFVYLDNTKTFKDYLKEEPIVVVKSLYEQLIDWLDSTYYPLYLQKNMDIFRDSTDNYVKSIITEYIQDLKDVSFTDSLPVLKNLEISVASQLENGKIYNFATKKNFFGNAAMEFYLKHKNVNKDYMFFTPYDNTSIDNTSDIELINNLFNEYLNYYFEVREISDIKDYLEKYELPNGIASYVIEGNVAISGIVRHNSNWLEMANILNVIYNASNIPIDIVVGFATDMEISFVSVFETDENGVPGVYAKEGKYGNLISDTLRNYIANIDIDIFNSFTKNNTTEYGDNKLTPKAFNDYYLIYDEEKNDYAMIRVFSDYVLKSDNNYHNYGKIEILKIPDFIPDEENNISFKNTVNEDNIDILQITIKVSLNETDDSDKNKVIEIIKAIDKLLNYDSTSIIEQAEFENEITYNLVRSNLNKN